jgi:hypothetical protein
MRDTIIRTQVTIRAMKLMVEALEDVGQHLPQNPKLFSLLAESPLEDLRRMDNELSDHLAELRQVPAASVS